MTLLYLQLQDVERSSPYLHVEVETLASYIGKPQMQRQQLVWVSASYIAIWTELS